MELKSLRMKVIEKEVIYFKDEFIGGFLVNNIQILKSKLDSKLYSFNRDKDKLYFLNILRSEINTDKLKHEEECTEVDCAVSQEAEAALFVIDQEIERINKYFEFEPIASDKFKIEEQVELHTKLNNIEEQLKKLGFGQEVIFNEIDELKQNFNLGKKNWFQLVRSKFYDLIASKVVEETVIKEIYSQLSKGFENLPTIIDKL